MGVAAAEGGEEETAVDTESAGAGAVPDGELAGDGDGGPDACCPAGDAGSVDRCCHLILLLNRLFIPPSLPRARRLGFACVGRFRVPVGEEETTTRDEEGSDGRGGGRKRRGEESSRWGGDGGNGNAKE